MSTLKSEEWFYSNRCRHLAQRWSGDPQIHVFFLPSRSRPLSIGYGTYVGVGVVEGAGAVASTDGVSAK